MAATEETEFDPTLDSVELNIARVMGHVVEVTAAGRRRKRRVLVTHCAARPASEPCSYT